MASTLTVRVDDELYSELTALAQAQGVTLSELARRTLKAFADGAEGDPDRRSRSPLVPESLTTAQRHQLVLLHRIAERLCPAEPQAGGDREYHQKAAEIFERGYTSEYVNALGIHDGELSHSEAELVMDILDMFTQLEWSYGKLSDAERDALGESSARDVRFFGFDLNSARESRLLGYARHLIEQDKWETLARYFDDQHERGNSHTSASLPTYLRMLAEFRPIWRTKVRAMTGFGLSPEEIRRITDASVHPDHR